MAEEFGQDRTEAATPRRREEARQRGDVALSPDLTGGLLLLAALLVLSLTAGSTGRGLLDGIQQGMRESARQELGIEGLRELLLVHLGRAGELVGLLLGVLFVAGLGAGLLQVGFGLSLERLAWNWERLSPVQGFARMFSLAGVTRGLLAIAKVAVILLAAFVVLRGQTEQIATLGEGPLSQSVAVSWDLVVRLGMVLAGALVVLGAVDYLARRFRLERSLRMTRQELKEEIKREEGDPALRSRIRKLQREAVQRRMLEDVPKSTVVITNPTHLAIALLYDRVTMPAPRVLARGNGVIARRIVEAARRHAVPVVERKPLARALYRAARVGQEIPAPLFQAIAEVLAYVYRMRGGLPGKAM